MTGVVVDLFARERARRLDTWKDDLVFVTKKGEAYLDVTASNLIRILANHDEWRGVFRLNRLTGNREIHRAPPWPETRTYPRRVEDTDYTQTRAWFEDRGAGELRCKPSTALMTEVIATVAKDDSHHPIESYLDACVAAWDGWPRLDYWLTAFLGAEDSPYTRMVGRRWLISAVARIAEPGCKVDCALVLEGPQGCGKSTALALLGGEWFGDSPFDMSHAQKTGEAVRGKWIYELGELAALVKSDPEAVKACLSSTKDTYRPAYGRETVDVLRTVVFGGSTNLDDYLTDPTGARRFYPVRVTGLHRELFASVVDQLWAEAAVAYRKGEIWYLDTPGLVAAQTAATVERYVDDVWAAPIAEWLASETGRKAVARDEGVNVRTLLSAALDVPVERQTPAVQKRVVSILRGPGFGYSNTRNARKTRVWRKPPMTDTTKTPQKPLNH